MKTHGDMVKIYESLQEKGYGTAPMDVTRAEKIRDFITKNLSRGSVFDASCGRGHLVWMLKEQGYVVSCSEASKWLIDNVLSEFSLPIYNVRYDQLDTLRSDMFDVVVSNDVLEHLFDVNEVRAAMGDLCRISKRFVLVSVGLNYAKRQIKGKTVHLHHVVKPVTWWRKLYSEFCTITEDFTHRNSYFVFGEKRGS